MQLYRSSKSHLNDYRNLAYLNFLLKVYAGDAKSVMEVGSCTGRLLLSFKRRGITTFYNDLDIPEVLHARRKLEGITGEETKFLLGDYLGIEFPFRFDFIFSTGLLHTLPPEKQIQLVRKMSEDSKSTFILIPDLSDSRFSEDNTGGSPGRVGAAKYSLQDISRYLSTGYEYVQQGRISGSKLGVAHDFLFFFGGPSKSNLEWSRKFRIRKRLIDFFPIPSL
jgi:hypothetical protein